LLPLSSSTTLTPSSPTLLPLHDALPISTTRSGRKVTGGNVAFYIIKMLRSGRRSTGERRNDPMHRKAQLNGTCSVQSLEEPIGLDRKSTRLNSSHGSISYAVFCLTKKKK